jgi:hypothetical protein
MSAPAQYARGSGWRDDLLRGGAVDLAPEAVDLALEPRLHRAVAALGQAAEHVIVVVERTESRLRARES